MTLTCEEVLDAIRTEGLTGYRWFEDATNETDVIAIQWTSDGWVVFATDERGIHSPIHQYRSEIPARRRTQRIDVEQGLCVPGRSTVGDRVHRRAGSGGHQDSQNL